MKRALYLLLMVWIALQSALVQAHMVEESLHPLSHTQAAHGLNDADAASDADPEDACTTVVCGHLVAALDSSNPLGLGQLPSASPATVHAFKSAHALDDIERPKWPTPALGVAGV